MKLRSVIDKIDERWMRFAIALSEKAEGLTAENPNVGCVIIDVDGNLCASGFTQLGGRPHAEQVALEKAGNRANNGTLYVTLEPCSHFGKTPPCAHAIIEAGIKRVVVGKVDPDSRVNGLGIELLKNAGISIKINVLEGEITSLIRSFIARQNSYNNDHEHVCNSMPFIVAKIAHSVDGFVSRAKGVGGQISNKVSSAYVHDLRSRVDAVLISQQTAIVDDPRLNARIEGLNFPTTRVLLDRKLEVLEKSMLVQTSNIDPLIIVTQNKPEDSHWIHKKQKNHKIQLIVMQDDYSLECIFKLLLKRGLGYILVEAGPRLLDSLLSQNLADTFIQIISRKKMQVGLSVINTQQSVAFLPPSPYVISKQFNLADDIVKIWKR